MDSPFISKGHEYNFYLTKLEGQQRNKLLNITDHHYDNPKLAKQWYDTILHHITPLKDINAQNILLKLYKILVEE